MSEVKIPDIASRITREVGMPFPRVIRVLVVDDSKEDIHIAKHALEKSEKISYIVESISGGDISAEIAKGNYDVYLVDVRVGQHDGLELIDEAFQAGHRGPFVVLTGSMVPDADEMALKIGAMDYVDKTETLVPKVLDRKIRTAIRNFRVQEALRRRLKVAEDALSQVKPNGEAGEVTI